MRTFRIKKAMVKGWRQAVEDVERKKSFDSLTAYLLRPGVQLGPAECEYLAALLGRLQYFRKKRGGFVRLGRLSDRQRYEIAAEQVRELICDAKARGEKLSTAKAVERVAAKSSKWFTAARLADLYRRGGPGGK